MKILFLWKPHYLCTKKSMMPQYLELTWFFLNNHSSRKNNASLYRYIKNWHWKFQVLVHFALIQSAYLQWWASLAEDFGVAIFALTSCRTHWIWKSECFVSGKHWQKRESTIILTLCLITEKEYLLVSKHGFNLEMF